MTNEMIQAAHRMAQQMIADGVTVETMEANGAELTDAYFAADNKKQISMCMIYLTNTKARDAAQAAALKMLRA